MKPKCIDWRKNYVLGTVRLVATLLQEAGWKIRENLLYIPKQEDVYI